ncbi:MAG: hypothetical protein O7D30_03515, partial [Rickettsia endosymbiont of Ixodes persulcatus]|nr:hypothetical protein [Rickettsia endosymbiont of Ixodes persulcatus]
MVQSDFDKSAIKVETSGKLPEVKDALKPDACPSCAITVTLSLTTNSSAPSSTVTARFLFAVIYKHL